MNSRRRAKKPNKGIGILTMTENNEKIRLIIVEDHAVVREGLVAMINTQIDMEVVASCGDPIKGLELINKFGPAIVMTDISMPEGMPFDMVRNAKEKFPDLKVVFLTGFATDSNLEKALRSGGDGFVSKSEPIQNIMEGIREVYSGGTFFSNDIRERIVRVNRPSGHSASEGAQNEFTVKIQLLSDREAEVLCCVARGLSARQIAGALHISAKTVERHKSNIMAKLTIHTQVDLARFAIREGLVAP
jgi:two-component system response regulator NreC